MNPQLKLPTIAALAVAAVAFMEPAGAAERHGDNGHRGQRYEQQQQQKPAYRGTGQRNDSYRKTERSQPNKAQRDANKAQRNANKAQRDANKAQRDANKIKKQAREERAAPRPPQGNANRKYGYTQQQQNRDNRVTRNNDRYSGDRNRQRNDYRDGRGNRVADNDRYRDNRRDNYRDTRPNNYRDNHSNNYRDGRDRHDGDRRDNRYSRDDHRKDYRDNRNYRDRGYHDRDRRDRYTSYRGKQFDRDRYRYNYKRQKHWAKAYTKGYRAGRYDSRRYDYYRPYWDFGYFHKHRHYYSDWRPYFGRLWLGFAASIAWQSSYDDDCHPVTRIDNYRGRAVLVGGIMCYDRWGQAFIVPESEEILHWY